MYDNGRGTPKNDALAMKWYLKAAQQGVGNAQFNIGIMYEHGQVRLSLPLHPSLFPRSGEIITQTKPSTVMLFSYLPTYLPTKRRTN